MAEGLAWRLGQVWLVPGPFPYPGEPIVTVLHLLELSVSLLSTTKLADAGVGTNTTLKHIDLIDTHTSRLMDCAYCFHNLYKLKVKIVHPNEAWLAWTHPPSKVSLALWHHWLGHISEDTIQKMVQADAITGVGRIIISYKNCLPSVVLMVKTCCHYCPDFYY